MKKFKILLITMLVLISTITFSKEKLTIALFSPGTKDDTFWKDAMDFAKAAAKDLDIDLSIHYGDRLRAKTVSEVKRVINSRNQPDFIVFSPHQFNGPEILEMIEEAKIPTFTYNSEPIDVKGNRPGQPRENNQYWIGEMFPDDVRAAKNLMLILARKAREIGLDDDGKVTVLPIDGNLSDGAGIKRHKGFMEALEIDDNIIEIKNHIKGFWKRNLSKRNFKFAYRKYQEEINIVWAANDIMLMGAFESIVEDFDEEPGKDVLLGAFDWNDEILGEIDKGRVYAAYGGHFMEAGWIMVLLHDYYNGLDFAKTDGVSIKSQLNPVTVENFDEYNKVITEKDWESIDFKKYSKIYKKYDFGPYKIFEK